MQLTNRIFFQYTSWACRRAAILLRKMDEKVIQTEKTEESASPTDNGVFNDANSDGSSQGEIEDLIPDAASAEDLKILEEMMRAGLMYGHKKSKTNPKFRKYIYTTRNGIEIIDLVQTLEALDKAIEFLKSKMKDGGGVLLIATQPSAKEAAEKLAKKFNFSYVSGRWIGGLLTNFKVLSRRIEYFKKLKSDLEKGRLEKYTKKERVIFGRSIARMQMMFEGMENLEKIPDVLFLIDTSIKSHITALREARRLKIKTIAIIDSDDNPELVDYPIPANDHAKISIEWLINVITDKLATSD